MSKTEPNSFLWMHQVIIQQKRKRKSQKEKKKKKDRKNKLLEKECMNNWEKIWKEWMGKGIRRRRWAFICKCCHSLSLLVLRIRCAYHINTTTAFNSLTKLAHLLNRWSHLHRYWRSKKLRCHEVWYPTVKCMITLIAIWCRITGQMPFL